MLICKKKRCIWRVYCGDGKYYCHKAGNCPNVMTAKEKLPKVKWSGIIKRKKTLSYQKYASKRNKNRGDVS